MKENKGLWLRYRCRSTTLISSVHFKAHRQAHPNAGERHPQQRGCVGMVYPNRVVTLGKYGDGTAHVELLHGRRGQSYYDSDGSPSTLGWVWGKGGEAEICPCPKEDLGTPPRKSLHSCSRLEKQTQGWVVQGVGTPPSPRLQEGKDLKSSTRHFQRFP